MSENDGVTEQIVTIPNDSSESYEPLSHFPEKKKRSIDTSRASGKTTRQFFEENAPSNDENEFQTYLKKTVEPFIMGILEWHGYPKSFRLVRIGDDPAWKALEDFSRDDLEKYFDAGVLVNVADIRKVIEHEIKPEHEAETICRIIRNYEQLKEQIATGCTDNQEAQIALSASFFLGEAITHYRYATNHALIKKIRAHRALGDAQRGRVPAWRTSIRPIVEQWCKEDPSLNLSGLTNKIHMQRETLGVGGIPTYERIKAGLKAMENDPVKPLVIPNRGGRKGYV